MGCTTNLLSKQVFGKLPEQVRNCPEEGDSHCIMADGTQLSFYGVLKLEEIFILNSIIDEAILGMAFLVAHNCSADFNQPVVLVDR